MYFSASLKVEQRQAVAHLFKRKTWRHMDASNSARLDLVHHLAQYDAILEPLEEKK